MDYSRLMMGISSGGSGGGDSGGSDNPSVEPTTKTISDVFAEPNLPQQYVETLGAPFGDRYVYTIFMQGINVLPEIPSSAEGSELTARVKEQDGNKYRIVEFSFVKQEGEWTLDGDSKTISEWTEEESGGGSETKVITLSNACTLFVNGKTVTFVARRASATIMNNSKVPPEYLPNQQKPNENTYYYVPAIREKGSKVEAHLMCLRPTSPSEPNIVGRIVSNGYTYAESGYEYTLCASWVIGEW